ncbi:MAG: acylase [Chitinophagia bacterium]|nr:acylase [Chitinophagia bacterium]
MRFLFLLLLVPALSAAQIDPKRVTIARDSFGVPHIFAKTDPEVSYGLAWAHSEDDFRSIQLVALPSKGLMGRVLGMQGVSGDFAFALFRCREITEEKWHTLSPGFLRLIEGYLQGVNDYAKAHPEEVLHPKLFPITAKEYIASSVLSLTVFNGGGRTLSSIYNNTVPSVIDFDKMGSNAIAIHPSRTNTGEAFLAINAHQPNEGPEAFYEAHVNSEEGWNALGGLLAGGPCILHGVNEHLGWAHTVNLCDRTDVFQLQMNPDNPNQYRFDGQWVDLERSNVRLHVKGVPVPVKRELLWSKYGATLRNKQGVFSIRLGANMEIRALEQWYRMNKAQNYTQFRQAVSLQGLSMFNIMYADRHDTIFYINNALMPVREASPQFDWKSTLPGNTSKTLWTRFRGIDELPQYVNPKGGFLFNTNHSSFFATAPSDNLRAAAFPRQDGWETNHNNRSIRFLELLPEGPVDFATFRRIKFDRQLPEKLHYPIGIDTLWLMRPEDYPAYDTLLRNLQQWDHRGVADSKGAAVFLMVYENVSKKMRGREGVQIDKATCETVLREIREKMLAESGRIDPTLGDLQKLVRGDREYPAHGLPDLLAPEWGNTLRKGVRKIAGGDAYVALVRFPRQGLPIIETVNTYGASSKPGSPHFADQVPLFLEQRTKRMTLDKAEVMAKAVRTYHPGE